MRSLSGSHLTLSDSVTGEPFLELKLGKPHLLACVGAMGQ